MHVNWHTFLIHLVVCLTTGPTPLPKRALHIVRSRASSFKWEYPLLSLRSSSSFRRLRPHFIFLSITRCRRQFLRKMWPIQFAFRLRISCRIFLCSLTLRNTSSFLTRSVQLIFSILLQHHISKLSTCYTFLYVRKKKAAIIVIQIFSTTAQHLVARATRRTRFVRLDLNHKILTKHCVN